MCMRRKGQQAEAMCCILCAVVRCNEIGWAREHYILPIMLSCIQMLWHLDVVDLSAMRALFKTKDMVIREPLP